MRLWSNKTASKKNYDCRHDKTALCLLRITTNLPQQLLSFGYTSQYITREFQYLHSLFACGTYVGSYQFGVDFVRNRGHQQPE